MLTLKYLQNLQHRLFLITIQIIYRELHSKKITFFITLKFFLKRGES